MSDDEAIDFEQTFGNKKFYKLPKPIQDQIVRSWSKIFDLNFDLAYYTLPLEQKAIQATFWKLEMGDVVKVERFIAK